MPFFTINVGFVETIDDHRGDISIYEKRVNNIIDSKEQENYRRPFSCEDLNSKSIEEDHFWHEELIYNAHQNL
jgi:hypothetical protein